MQSDGAIISLLVRVFGTCEWQKVVLLNWPPSEEAEKLIICAWKLQTPARAWRRRA
jgi:hypothetical protein